MALSAFTPMSAHTLIMCIIFPTLYASNILIVPFESEGSHYFVMKAIADELVNRGHTVTMLLNGNYEAERTSKDQNPGIQMEFFKANFTLSEVQNFLTDMTNAGLRGEYISFMMDLLETDFMERHVTECHNILNNVELMSRLQKSNFEVALVDFGFECPLLQFLQKTTGVPYVTVSAVLALPALLAIQNRFPFNPAYMPELLTGMDHKMPFYDRLINMALAALFTGMTAAMANPFEETTKLYGIPDASLFHADAELWLMNTHFVLDFPKPLLPNTIPIGGLTTRAAKPLSKDFEDFVNSAGDDGVVLFSMGSYAKGIDENIAAMFAGAFAQVPQKIIWKLNGKPSATLTTNVKVVDWMPQNDLLGHPQVKAFVTHCGMNGVWEAVYHGVPMVAIPLFGDQPDNAQRIVSRGIGVRLDISTLTSDKLAEGIRTVVSDPSYKSNATRLSSIFRDTPRKPVEVAADWSEYVMRHGGAKHLRSAALDLNIFQYFLLDVILVILLALITFCVVAICLCRLCYKGCRQVCGGSSKVKTQ